MKKTVTLEQASILRKFGYDANESTPTMQDVADWMREVHALYTYPRMNAMGKWFTDVIDIERNESLLLDGNMFDTFDEALNHGIEFCIRKVGYRVGNYEKL